MTQQIFQNQAASYCLLDNVSVFLDRRNDKYHYIDREKTEFLNSLRKGSALEGSNQSKTSYLPDDVIFELKKKHLLTTELREGKKLQPVEHPRPRASIYDVYWGKRLYPMTIIRLALTYAVMQRRIMSKTLYQITQQAEILKADTKFRTLQKNDEEIFNTTKRLIDSRYFVYTYKDKCLFDSCLFFHHFITQAIPVNWVFGVNLFPFSAHSWVEYKGLVLNDRLERVAAFTPVYVV